MDRLDWLNFINIVITTKRLDLDFFKFNISFSQIKKILMQTTKCGRTRPKWVFMSISGTQMKALSHKY